MEDRSAEEYMLNLSLERRARLFDDLEELRNTIRVIEKHARRLERELAEVDEHISDLRSGEWSARLESMRMRQRQRFMNMSIPDAAEEAIRKAERPLHVGAILDVLEAGGKKFDAARPAVSIASALSRDARFVRVGPNTFDLVERTQPRLPIEE